MQITSKQGQWLGDIAVREAGSTEAIIDMSIINNVSVTGKMSIGTSLQKPTPLDRRVVNYNNVNNIHPATATEPTSAGATGIGHMTVGITFIVS